MTGFIYRITNKNNGKFYIGLTVVSIRDRLCQHMYHARHRSSYGLSVSHLHRAILKYGIEAFEIEWVASPLGSHSLSDLERLIISQERPDYNQTGGGEATAGRKVDEFVRSKISLANKGKKRTKKHREIMSQRMRREIAEGRLCKFELLNRLNKDKHLWEQKRIDTVRKVSKSRKRTPEEIEKSAAARRKPVFCQQTDTVYPSRKEASLSTGVSKKSIWRACNNEIPSVRGYTFRYV